MSSSFVLSDLHLLSDRSDAQIVNQILKDALAKNESIILNGDTFDFAWCKAKSVDLACQEAAVFIKDLLLNNPKNNFIYILGNHDNVEAFISLLKRLEAEFSNLKVYEFEYRAKNSLFLHGDVCNYKMNLEQLILSRANYLNVKRRSSLKRGLYHLVILFKLNRIAYLTHFKRVLAGRILFYLGTVDKNYTEGITDIYFGHTHVPFENYLFKGIRFHNTGSAIKGMKHIFKQVAS